MRISPLKLLFPVLSFQTLPHSFIFRILQLLCLPLLRKLPGVYQQFPFWNSPLVLCALCVSALQVSLLFHSTFNLQTCQRFFIYPLSFHTLAHSFARIKNSTLFFSIVSALFVKNYRGWGTPLPLHEEQNETTNCSFRLPSLHPSHRQRPPMPSLCFRRALRSLSAASRRTETTGIRRLAP